MGQGSPGDGAKENGGDCSGGVGGEDGLEPDSSDGFTTSEIIKGTTLDLFKWVKQSTTCSVYFTTVKGIRMCVFLKSN